MLTSVLLALLAQPVPADTASCTFHETQGSVAMEAENYSAMTGAWRRVQDGDRVVMRMNGPGGKMFEGRHM